MTKSARFSVIVGGLGLLVLLLVGIVVAFSLMRVSQDVRNQAAVKSGVVIVGVAGPSTNGTSADQPLSLDIRVNTSGAAVDAVQLKAEIVGVPVSDLSFTPSNTVRDLKPSLVRTTDNRVELIFTLANPNQPFVTTSNLTLGRLTMVPRGTGTLRITWDNVDSKATLYQRGVDSLRAIEGFTIAVDSTNRLSLSPPIVPPTPTPTSSVQIACEASGGVWRQFPDSCGDSCGLNNSLVMCAKVLTYGCDCGGSACWNGQTCTPDSDARPTPKPTTSPTPDPYYCIPRPSCLDSNNPCRIAEPAAGWCPRPTVSPTPTPTVKPSASPTVLPTNRPTPSPTPSNGCVRAGCSNQLCVSVLSRDIITTCEYRPEYACYQDAVCEPQANGACGFTPTSTLTQCLDGARPTGSPTPTPTTSPQPTVAPGVIFDLNGDGRVNLADLTLVIQYLQSGNLQADFNQDGRVNILDYSIFIQQLGGNTARAR